MQHEMPLYRTTSNFQENHKTTALKCKNCKGNFLANRKTAQFCSNSCRSQFWMTKNKMKVITLAVPEDIDEEFLEKVKQMLVNYKSNQTNGDTAAPNRMIETFSSEKELRDFMMNTKYKDFKIPKHDMGIYYDEGLTITKHEDSWEVKINP